jgi:HEAT repeat protein
MYGPAWISPGSGAPARRCANSAIDYVPDEAYYRDITEAVAPVAALATDSAPRVRAMVAYALSRLNSAAATPTLLLLNDPQRHIRERAVEALGTIGGAAAVDALLPLAAAPEPQ